MGKVAADARDENRAPANVKPSRVAQIWTESTWRSLLGSFIGEAYYQVLTVALLRSHLKKQLLLAEELFRASQLWAKTDSISALIDFTG
jgi:hypothetical protein